MPVLRNDIYINISLINTTVNHYYLVFESFSNCLWIYALWFLDQGLGNCILPPVLVKKPWGIWVNISHESLQLWYKTCWSRKLIWICCLLKGSHYLLFQLSFYQGMWWQKMVVLSCWPLICHVNYPYWFSVMSSYKVTGLIVCIINTLRPRQNGRRFADDTFKRIFLNENVRISIKISLKFVPKGQINNIPALVQIMAWRRPGDKPLSEPRVVGLSTHICVTRPQWVKP